MWWKTFGLATLDLAALVWFFAWWVGYWYFAEWRARKTPSLISIMAQYRRDWWVRLIERELRMIDTSIIANLSNSSTFFASTALLILGGLLALLGTTEKLVAVVRGLPFNRETSESLWELKILLLVGIFIYAFFKFTWSLRQFNMASVLVGAAPKVPADAEDERDFIDGAYRISHLAAENFNHGLRAYYFALAALTWFLNGWLFMAATTWVVMVLYWREFRSPTAQLLQRSRPAPGPS